MTGQSWNAVRRRCVVVLAALLMAAFIPLTAQARQATPTETVDGLHSALLGVMQQANALGFQGRYNTLAATVMSSFNFPLMAQVSVGRRWKGLSEAQQARFIDAFTRMTLVTYATRFDSYSGERFEFVEEGQTARSIVVRTRLRKADGETIRLDYLLRRFDSQWLIIDVLAKGSYSELATRRSEYISVLKRDGFEGLMAKLDRKVAELMQKSATR
jgi:phospholipid transport system substrate-binding protein